MLTQIAKCYACGQIIAHEVICCLGYEGLLSVTGCSQPGAPVDGAAIVIALAQIGLACVQGETHLQRRGSWPCFLMQGFLDGRGSAQRIAGLCEDRKSTVSLATGTGHNPTALTDAVLYDFIMAHESGARRLRVRFPKSGTPLDVRKQECDRTRGQRCIGWCLEAIGQHSIRSFPINRCSSAAV